MSDHVTRAAEVLFQWNVRHGPYFVIGGGHVFDMNDPYKPIAQALADAGLLATPERDAAVAAEALREVVEIFDGDCIDLAEELRWTTDAPKGWSEGSVAFAIEATLLFGPWLTARADQIEREAGESDADAAK